MVKRRFTRRNSLKAVGLGAAALLRPRSALCREGPRQDAGRKDPKRPRPNILWISCEDISPDLGCYGDSYADTPNLDRLAEQGCRYTRAFTVSGVCAPSRSAIITGMYPTSIGTMHMRTGNKGYEAVPQPEVKCFTEYLRAAGYFCTNHTKTDYQFACPFTAWDQGKDWRNRRKGMPFFSVINLTMTHESRIWPRKAVKLIHDPAKAELPPYYPDTPVVRRDWAQYYDNITNLDSRVGEILRRLEAGGLAEDTVVFFWSDHGRGLPRAKRWIYDSGIHVPLIIRWPGTIKPGSVCEDLVSFLDLGPTVLSIAGLKVPSHMQGRAFRGGQRGKARDYIYAARDRMDETAYDMIRCVRDKRYKYIKNFQPKKPYAQNISYMDKMPTMQEWRRLAAEGKLTGPQKLFFQRTKPPEELYDTKADPHEIHNLVGSQKHQKVLKRMSAALAKWMKDVGDLGRLPEDKLIESMWPGGKQPVTAAPTIKTSTVGGEATVEIACATRGASIGYHLGRPKSGKARWVIYTGPFFTKTGAELTAKAIRLGCKPSREVREVIGHRKRGPLTKDTR